MKYTLLIFFFMLLGGCAEQLASPPEQETDFTSSLVFEAGIGTDNLIMSRDFTCKTIEKACKKACIPGDDACVLVCKVAKKACDANPPHPLSCKEIEKACKKECAPADIACPLVCKEAKKSCEANPATNPPPKKPPPKGPPPANGAPPIATILSYDLDIKPLMTYCNDCHGVNNTRGAYRTDTYAGLLGVGKDGLANVIPGDKSSRLVTYTSIAVDHKKANATVPGIAENIFSWVMGGAFESAMPTPIPPVAAPPVTVPPIAAPPVTSPPVAVPPVTAPPGTSQIFLGVGNIGDCGKNGNNITPADVAASGTQATGLILDKEIQANPNATVFTVGDNQYVDGSQYEFANCYDKTAWGTHKGKTRAVMGDHDTKTIVNGGYYAYEYYGVNSGTPSQHWYSYDLGSWHIIVLDSNVTASLGSTQNNWLRNDLAASTKTCTMALFHHPYFSAGGINTAKTKPMWDALYEFGADVIFSAHVHAYQRLAPMRPDGTLDAVYGIRSFVVGTGGAALANLPSPSPVTENQNSGNFGIVKFELSDNAYNWVFIPVAGKTATDSGSGVCHGAPL